MLKLVLKLKSNKSLKLRLVDMKMNNSHVIGDGKNGTKQAEIYYLLRSLKLEQNKQIQSNQIAIYKKINLILVNI